MPLIPVMERAMTVDILRCPNCSIWIVIEPLETQQYRAKRCDNCEKDLRFLNSELIHRDVPDAIATRGYFTDLELALKRQR
jgi:uncharacterized paraquat-inducible protein A